MHTVIRTLALLAAMGAAAPAYAAKPPKTPPPRTEHDLIGEKQIPDDVYWGVQTARALENFQFSDVKMNTYPEFVKAFAIVKIAAARANAKTGTMKADRLAAIEKAGQAI